MGVQHEAFRNGWRAGYYLLIALPMVGMWNIDCRPNGWQVGCFRPMVGNWGGVFVLPVVIK